MPSPLYGPKKLFLSAVSSEFESYRQLLASDLKRPALDVAVQEDFIVSGGSTLEKLDEYIRSCHGVVHLIGKATGAAPEPLTVQALLARYRDFATKLPSLTAELALPDPGFSYTQWEAYLAIYHQRPVFIYRPEDFALVSCQCPRKAGFVPEPAQEQAQQRHYQRICALGRDRGQFLNEERLSSAVLRDLVHILPALEHRFNVPPTKLTHTAEVLLGRDAELTILDAAWNDPHKNVVIVRGKGGEGKTALVATWMAELASKDWRGAECVFDWSFYSQGTKDQAATAEVFIQEALAFFHDPDPLLGGPDERGARLAKLVGAKRCLLVLDGLEPLQYPPGPMHGHLKDPGMAALLRGLAGKNAGLCVVTTREKVDEIKQHYGRSAVDHPLEFLSPAAGAALLHLSGATRAGAQPICHDDPELRQASTEVQGHALTLMLMGQYLRLTADGDIRQRDRMKLADADAEYKNDATRPYGHAFKAIEAYEKWFAGEQKQRGRLMTLIRKLWPRRRKVSTPAGQLQQLAILRILGLFDRPAPAGCLSALREAPVISGLTESLAAGANKDWKLALARLAEINIASSDTDGTVDCHPLIREYFAVQLRTHQPDAFRAAHSRLFDHLCKNTPHQPDTLAGLQPLYQAVAHGCLAGRQQDACDKVYFTRILRGNEAYSGKILGAIGADLGAIGAFFEEPWSRLSPKLSTPDQAWLLNEAAFSLRALGRLTEAVEPMRVSGEMYVSASNWKGAAVVYGNLSKLEVTSGLLSAAEADGRRAIKFADRSEDAFQKLSRRAIAADALHQVGKRTESEALFAEVERMQAEHQPEFPLLYSLQGFFYADLLSAPAELAAWQTATGLPQAKRVGAESRNSTCRSDLASASCDEANRRATQTLQWGITYGLGLLDIALDYLTLARAQLYRALLAANSAPPETTPISLGGQTGRTASLIPKLKSDVSTALAKLRQANNLDHLPQALLTAALYAGAVAGQIEEAQDYLNEAQTIAERGPMPLYLADVHLHRARLFGKLPEEVRRAKFPEIDPRAELAEARRLIEKHGYWRRKEELEDAEAAAAYWSGSTV